MDTETSDLLDKAEEMPLSPDDYVRAKYDVMPLLCDKVRMQDATIAALKARVAQLERKPILLIQFDKHWHVGYTPILFLDGERVISPSDEEQLGNAHEMKTWIELMRRLGERVETRAISRNDDGTIKDIPL